MSGFILVLLIIVGALVVGSVIAKKRTEAWQATARRLGFRFTGGGLFESRALTGTIDGFYVKAYEFSRGSGKNKKTYTGYRAEMKADVPAGFALKTQGFFSGFAKFFGSQDIEIGDRQFDDSVIIQGRNPDRIGAFLTPSRRMRILSLMQRYTECEIDGGGIYVANRRGESDPAQLEAHMRRVVEVAQFFSEAPTKRAPLDQAIVHRLERAAESALDHVREVNRVDTTPDPDALELEGELLYLSGQYDEAAEKFTEASASQPANKELTAWAEASVDRAKKAAAPTTAMVATEKPADPEQAYSAELIETLFIKTTSRFEATRRFESAYEGKTAHWSGTVTRVQEYSYDLVFKSGPGLIAHFELQKLDNNPYGIRAITAAVQLPPNTELKERLEAGSGQTFTFSGRLLKCDAFNGTVFLESGELQ